MWDILDEFTNCFQRHALPEKLVKVFFSVLQVGCSPVEGGRVLQKTESENSGGSEKY